MPESRDRLARPDDVTAMFDHLRRSINQRRILGIAILPDEPEIDAGTPFRWGETATTTTATPGVVGMTATRGGGVGRGNLGTPTTRNGRGRNSYRTPAVGRENMSVRRSQGRSSNSALPSWYPRRPLRDITAISLAINRRRARLREAEGQIESPIPLDQDVHDLPVPISGAQLEHDFSLSPDPTVRVKPSPLSVGKVPKILLDITNQKVGESGCLTPQQKLLNSIDIVEKVVLDELNKLKRTPSAKKVERERKVRTLMSMR